MPADDPEMHYRRLERMYLRAPTNLGYVDLRLRIEHGTADVGFQVTPDLHHAAGGMHGAHYFKLLDDAAFFAANSLVPDVFVLTTQFSVQLLTAVSAGVVRATGTVTRAGSSLLFAESVLVDERQRELARGHGTFAKSHARLESVPGYLG